MKAQRIGSLSILCLILSIFYIPLSVAAFFLLILTLIKSDHPKIRSSLMFMIQGCLAFALFSLVGVGIHELGIVPSEAESKGVKAAFLLTGIMIYVIFSISGSISYWMNVRKYEK